MSVTAQMRRCTGCGRERRLSDFHRQSNAPRGRRSRCKDCISQRNRELYERNPDNARWRRIKHLYGITPEEYQAIHDAQEGRCAICGRHKDDLIPRRGRDVGLNIDHDHETGKVRGLLCTPCNLAIGYIESAGASTKAVVAYLEGGEDVSR